MYKAMYKYELAAAAGVSKRTLQRWLQDPKIAQKLSKLGVTKRRRMLPPSAVKMIAEHYVIEIS